MATSLEESKKRGPDRLSKHKTLSYSVRIAKIAHGWFSAYDTKFVAMITSLKKLKKEVYMRKFHQKRFHTVKRL